MASPPLPPRSSEGLLNDHTRLPRRTFHPRVRSFALHRQPTERPGHWLYYLYVVTNPSEVCDAYARG